MFEPWFDEIGASLALIVLMVVLRIAATRIIRVSAASPETRRRWLVHVRTATVLVLVFGVTVIWAEELRTFAVSLVAVAVAVTIATKELLLCLSGSLIRTSSRAYTIGDRIQIGGFRGDVIDIGALSTKILEVDEETQRRTGRLVSVPNSVLLDKPAVNETFAGHYVLSTLSIPLPAGADWKRYEAMLLASASAVCRDFLSDATRQIVDISTREGLDPPVVQPKVHILLDKPNEVRLLLRFPTAVRQTSRTRQHILRRFLDESGLIAPAESAETPAKESGPVPTIATPP